jgi:hypothetical protein
MVFGCVGHRGRLIESRIWRGNPEYAHGILHDIRNFVRSVREEYLEYLQFQARGSATCASAAQTPEGVG